MSTQNPNSDNEYSECLMGSMVTPGEYWLINKSPTHTLEVQQLEKELSAEMVKNSDVPRPEDVGTTACIAVECPPANGVWKRGRAVSKIGRAVFKVFLVDSGQVIQVSIKRIRTSLDPRFLKVEPLAFKFCLYGIVPCSVQPDGKKKVTLKWTDESRIFVTKLLSKKHFFHIKIVHMLGRTLLGDIYLFYRRSGQFYSLSRLLCAKDLAIYAEPYYREKVMLLEHSLVDNRYLTPDSEVSVHMDTKLKRMEELRLVNMHHEFDWNTQRERRGNSSGSESDENEQLAESALCDNSSQLAQELLHNLNIRRNLRSQSVSDLPEDGPSTSSDLQNNKLDKALVDGSHGELPPLESVKRKPRPKSQMEEKASRPLKEKKTSKKQTEEKAPRPLKEKKTPKKPKEKRAPGPMTEKETPKQLMEKQSPRPLMEIEIPKPLMEKLSPRPLMEIEIPKPSMEKPVPRPLMEIEIPKPVVEKPVPRPLMEIQIPMPVMEKQSPKPLTEKLIQKPLTILEFPKPLIGIEIPKPLEGIEFRKPFIGGEIPRPLEKVEFRKPLVGREGPKPLEGTGTPKPLEGLENPKPLEGIEKPKPLEATEKPKPLEVTEKPKPLEVTEKPKPLEVTEKPKPLEVTEKPKPLEGIEKPMPLVRMEKPKPLERIGTAKPLEGLENPKPLEATEKPKSLQKKGLPKPLERKESREQSKGKESWEPSKGKESWEPSKGKESWEPSKGKESREPSKGKESREPSKGKESWEPSKGKESREPSKGKESREPSKGKESRKPSKGKESRKPLVGMETPKLKVEKQIPEPFMEVETSKPSKGKQLPKSFIKVETSKPSKGKQLPQPYMEVETSKPFKEKQNSEPFMEFEMPKRPTGNRTLSSYMDISIPEPAAKNKVSKACNENNLNAPDGQKKVRKAFRIIFDEKSSFPGVEVVGSHEVFYIFFDNVLDPLDSFDNLNVSSMLFKNIERQIVFEQPTPIQKWAIPSIVNGDDLVIIGGPKSGKTSSYILGVLEVLKLKMEVGQFQLGKGPLAVILSSSSRTCEFIYRIFTLLITNKDRKVKAPLSKLNVRYVNNAIVERHSVPFIVNRCDILISTPQCLLRILNNRNITYLNRLNMLVFDGADLCAGEPFLTEMKILLNQSKMPKNVQKIFCGERWTHDFEVLTRTFVRDHSAVIGSFLEAATYANLQPNMFFINALEKDRTLLDLALKEHKGQKVIIVCSKIEEVTHVETLFKNENKICPVAHSETNAEELKSIKYNWGRSKEWCVIACTQDIIESLGIQNADVLINYSLPSNREISFASRFMLISNKVRDYIFRGKARPSIHFLIDDKTYFRLPELVDYLKRQGVQIPPDIKDDVDAEIEASEKELPLCDNVLKFGNCKELWKCNKRHTFNKELDIPEQPLCGIIKFLVLRVHSTSHLSGRVVEFSDQQNKYKKVTFPDLTLQVTRQLRNIFREKEKRILLNPVKVNTICVLNRNDASGMRFHRAKVMEIKTFGKSHKPEEVIVKLIDWGTVLQANVGKLLELPEEMRVYPPLAADIYLCNLVPKDFDREWSDRDVSFAQNMFMMELEENQVWIARVKLSLESAFLVDPVKLCHTLDSENTCVIEFSASQKLIYCGIADEKPEHLKTVYALCEKANIDTSIYEYNLDASENSWQPECAHFDTDFLKIQFIYAESPTSLYVRISKFEDLLISLEAECNAEGVRQKNSENCNLNNPVLRKKLSVGMCCLALNGTSWNRAKILSFEKDRAKVFFIDYGDTEYVEHVVPISEKLIMKLPAQAIECYLVGVNPEMKISDKVLGEIYDFSKNGSEELSVNLVEKTVKSEMTGGWKYGINLLNAEGKSLNKKLIDMGLVKPTRNHVDLAVDMENKLQIDDGTETDVDTWDEDCYSDGKKNKADLSRFENLSIVDSASGNDLNKDIAAPETVDELSYFLTMESGVFDDDTACCMLEEFLCNLAPEQVNRREPQNEANTEKKGVEPVPDPEKNEVTIKEEERVGDVVHQEVPQEQASSDQASQNQAPQKEAGEVVQNDSPLDEAAAMEARLKYLSKRTKPVKRTLPYLKHFPDKPVADLSKDLLPTELLTPEILWSQTHTEIEVKIMLTNVDTYKFDCSVENFIFRCLLDKKPYVSNVRLFGAVNPEMTRVEIKTFFVQIVFQKLCPLMWPRLCKENKKFRWIKYNIEHFKEKKSTISEILCSQAMERIKSGQIIVPKVPNEIKYVPSSSSEGSDWSDSDLEEDLSSHDLPSDHGDHQKVLEFEDCHWRFWGEPFHVAPLRVRKER